MIGQHLPCFIVNCVGMNHKYEVFEDFLFCNHNENKFSYHAKINQKKLKTLKHLSFHEITDLRKKLGKSVCSNGNDKKCP